MSRNTTRNQFVQTPMSKERFVQELVLQHVQGPEIALSEIVRTGIKAYGYIQRECEKSEH